MGECESLTWIIYYDVGFRGRGDREGVDTCLGLGLGEHASCRHDSLGRGVGQVPDGREGYAGHDGEANGAGVIVLPQYARELCGVNVVSEVPITNQHPVLWG